jgi:hypothetical protein
VLDVADEWFGGLERGYSINVRDLDVDRDLAAEATERGLLEVLSAPEMVCRQRLRDGPTPAGADLRWIDDDAGIRDFVTVNTAAYTSLGMPADVLPDLIVPGPRFLEPHIQSVVAYLDGEPVAAAQTLLSHGIAGVYWVGTVERARGTGLGEAVARAVTNRAFDCGALANTFRPHPWVSRSTYVWATGLCIATAPTRGSNPPDRRRSRSLWHTQWRGRGMEGEWRSAVVVPRRAGAAD